ncbi:hypothetical protein FCV25MIE_09808 [Fagus crenata]
MGFNSEADCALELEAMSKDDSSWHPCRVSFSSAEDGLIIEFESPELEDMLLQDEEDLTCLRFRSTPLQGDDCMLIEEGEHVLATHKPQSKRHFYDAKVEKVVRVRHSKKVYCRCTFTFKWLHQDLEGETFTVPSSSIMKLATKCINVHPVVAVFLKSVKQIHSSCASLFPTVLEETDGELDINKLLEKQIEDISNSANASKEGMSEDILLGVKVDNKGHIQHNAVAVYEVSISHAQALHDQNQLNRSTQNSSKLQVEMQVEDQPLAAPIQEELPENRSHLSPLAARAALASLMSTNHNCIALDGIKMFNSSGFNDMPMKDKVSSEISDAFIPVISASDKMIDSFLSTESKSQLVDSSSGVITKVNKSGKKASELTNSGVTLKCSMRETNVIQPTKSARITRSAVQKGTGIQNDDVQIETCSEDWKLIATTNKRRLTRSAVNEEKKSLIMEVKQVFEEKNLSHITESDSPEGSLSVPESNVSKKSRGLSTKKKTNSSPLDAEINILIEERKKRQISCAVKTTQQSEGKISGSSQGQKRKSSSSKKQEPRFSPRLHFLPRTRSQNKC